jgi:hypothetical protein
MADDKWKLQVNGYRIQCSGKDLFANIPDFQHPRVIRIIYPIRVNATFVILNINCVVLHSRIGILFNTRHGVRCLNNAINQLQPLEQKLFLLSTYFLFYTDCTKDDFNKSFIGLSPKISNKQQ